MTEVVLNINSKKKWNALKTILNAMDIEYLTKEKTSSISDAKRKLLQRAEVDKENNRLYTFTSNRDILGR